MKRLPIQIKKVKIRRYDDDTNDISIKIYIKNNSKEYIGSGRFYCRRIQKNFLSRPILKDVYFYNNTSIPPGQMTMIENVDERFSIFYIDKYVEENSRKIYDLNNKIVGKFFNSYYKLV